jgi:hypothetical protein
VWNTVVLEVLLENIRLGPNVMLLFMAVIY